MNKRELLVHIISDSVWRWWLIDNGSPTASGQLAGGDALPTNLQVQALRILVPSAWVTYRTVDLPKLRLKEAYKALAFILEDQLLEDPADLHFCLLKKNKNSYHLWMLAKSRLLSLHDAASQSGYRLMAVYPDYFALPAKKTTAESSTWVLGQTPASYCLRQTHFAGLGLGRERVGLVFPRLLLGDELPTHFIIPTTLQSEVLNWPGIASLVDTGKLQLTPWSDHGFPLGILTEKPPINLIRPKRAPISSVSPMLLVKSLWVFALISVGLVASMAWHTHRLTQAWQAAVNTSHAERRALDHGNLRQHVNIDWQDFLRIARVIKSIDGLMLLHLSFSNSCWQLSVQTYQFDDVAHLSDALNAAGFSVKKPIIHAQQKSLIIQLELRGPAHENK